MRVNVLPSMHPQVGSGRTGPGRAGQSEFLGSAGLVYGYYPALSIPALYRQIG